MVITTPLLLFNLSFLSWEQVQVVHQLHQPDKDFSTEKTARNLVLLLENKA